MNDGVSRLGVILAQSPQGRRELVAMLTEEDPGKVDFAVNCLLSGADLDSIPPLVACRQRHRDDARLVAGINFVISDLIGLEWHSNGWYYVRDWLFSYGPRMTGCKYADLWGQRVEEALREVQRQPNAGDGWDRFEQSLDALALSNDAGITAPVIVSLIAKTNPAKDAPTILPKLVRILQSYVGPIDLTETDDIAGQERAREAVLAWWEANKAKKPVFWVLDALACRGWATGKPSDARGTAAALLAALADGTPLERYAASRVLAYALPDGDSIVLDRHPLIWGKLGSRESQLMQDYLLKIVICRAYDWYFFQCQDYSWNQGAGKYERADSTTALSH